MTPTLPQLFKLMLQAENAAPATVRNYFCDANNFINWLANIYGISNLNEPSFVCKYITIETIKDYKNSLINGNAGAKTIKRKLSSLKKLVKFAQSHGWIENTRQQSVQVLTAEEFIFGSNNLQSPVEIVIQNFRNYLTKQRISQISVKNYASDIRDFLEWINQR
jgi:site-specific recombinase XerD